MGRMVPTGIKDRSDLENGNYVGNVEVFGEKYSKEKNLLMYGLQLNIVEPRERAGRKHFVNFVIGTEEDPDAAQAATWQDKADFMKRFTAACGVPLEGEDMDTVTAHVMRKNVCFRIEHRPGTGKFAGQTFVNVTKWTMEGTMVPGLDAISDPGVGAVLAAPTPIIAPGNHTAPAAAPAMVPAAPVAPNPVVPPAENPTQTGTGYPFPTPPPAA